MMPVAGQLSPAGSAAFSGYGGSALQGQARDETEEVQRRRKAARDAGLSPAGQALAIDYGALSVPGAAQ